MQVVKLLLWLKWPEPEWTRISQAVCASDTMDPTVLDKQNDTEIFESI